MTLPEQRLIGLAGLGCAALLLAGVVALLRRADGAAARDAGWPDPSLWQPAAAPVASLEPASGPLELLLAPRVDAPEPQALAVAALPSLPPSPRHAAPPTEVARRTTSSMAEALAQRLGWGPLGPQAQRLAEWLARKRDAQLHALDDPAAFNRAADDVRRELLALFGRPAAEVIAAQAPLLRADASRALIRVDLDGQPLPDAPATEPR
jgi:hypothetical protein